jgi:hypothetical protein
LTLRLLTKKTRKVKTWSKSEGIELFVELVDREDGSFKIEIEENVSE